MGSYDRRHVDDKMRKVKRAAALERDEFRYSGSAGPRVASSGATSPMMKADDPETRRLIDAALARRLT